MFIAGLGSDLDGLNAVAVPTARFPFGWAAPAIGEKFTDVECRDARFHTYGK